MSKDDSAATRTRLDALVLTPRAGSAILQPAVLSGRFTAGCPSGQRERSVKPSAQPTLVRTQHLPLPREIAPDLPVRGLGPSASCAGDSRLFPASGGCFWNRHGTDSAGVPW